MSSQEASATQVTAHTATAPLEPRIALRPPSSVLFPVSGVLLFLAGLAISIGPKYVPELAWYAKIVTRTGFSGQILCLGGMLMAGLGWIARYQRLHTRTLLEPGAAESMLEDLRADIVGTQDLIRQLGGMQVEQGVDIRYLKKAVGESRNEARAADPKDAIFRLAASLDQLGARLDQRIGEATNLLQDSNYELSSLVESSCEGLQDKIDLSSRSLSREVLDTLANLTTGLSEVDDDDGELDISRSEGLRSIVDLDEDPVQAFEEPERPRDLGLLNELSDMDGSEDSISQPSLFRDEEGATKPHESAG